jgi:lipocalin
MRAAGVRAIVGMALVLATTAAVQAEPAPLQTVPSVDVPRYMGTWHEIAKYPNWFQRKCASSTQANYTLQTDGRVQVLNRCKKTTRVNGPRRWVQPGKLASPPRHGSRCALPPSGCPSSPWSGVITGSSTSMLTTSGWS